jgi:hypothetical protein
MFTSQYSHKLEMGTWNGIEAFGMEQDMSGRFCHMYDTSRLFNVKFYSLPSRDMGYHDGLSLWLATAFDVTPPTPFYSKQTFTIDPATHTLPGFAFNPVVS